MERLALIVCVLTTAICSSRFANAADDNPPERIADARTNLLKAYDDFATANVKVQKDQISKIIKAANALKAGMTTVTDQTVIGNGNQIVNSELT